MSLYKPDPRRSRVCGVCLPWRLDRRTRASAVRLDWRSVMANKWGGRFIERDEERNGAKANA